MAFRVEISPRAFNDLDEIARYIKQQASSEQAEEWFNGMIAAIQRMFTARAEWPFDANPLFSNGVYGVRAVFCA